MVKYIILCINTDVIHLYNLNISIDLLKNINNINVHYNIEILLILSRMNISYYIINKIA